MGILGTALAVLGVNPAGQALLASPQLSMRLAALRAEDEQADRAERRNRVSGAGTRIVSGAIDAIEHNPELRGYKWYGSPGHVGVAQKMMKDGSVRSSVSYVYAPLLAAAWRFRPASDDALDREVADFVQWCLVERLAWHEILRRTVSDYSAFGFALAEMTDSTAALPARRFPLHPGRGYGIVPTGIHQIPAWTVDGWTQDKSNPAQLASVRQYLQGSDGEPMGYRDVPADRLIRWTWDQEGANFEGVSILRSAYAPWKMKTAFLTLAAMKHERLAVPTPVAYAAENASDDDITAAEDVLREMRANQKGYAVFDSGWKFEWTGATQSDGSNIEAAISYCDESIASNVSAGFMRLGLTGKTGSYALGATQQGQYHLAELAQARFVAGVWNLGSDGWSPVERLVRLNYGDSVALPRLEARNLPTAPIAERLPLLINAKTAGLVRADAKLEAAIREMAEVDPYDDESAFDVGGTVGGAGPVLADDGEDEFTDTTNDGADEQEPT